MIAIELPIVSYSFTLINYYNQSFPAQYEFAM